MEMCGEAENRLASELMQHEIQIEKDILDPLNQLAEVSTQVFPSLWTMVLMDYAICDCCYILIVTLMDLNTFYVRWTSPTYSSREDNLLRWC